MRILHVAAEIAPMAKVGGLGDVVQGLSLELSRLGHEVEILIPYYPFLDISAATREDFPHFSIYSVPWHSCTLRFLSPNDFTFPEQIYRGEDEIGRFLLFCRHAFHYLNALQRDFDVVHLHDWPVTILAFWIKSAQSIQSKIILSIHNLSYQGIYPAARLPLQVGNPTSFLDPLRPDHINLLLAGIIYSDAIVAVSPSYASEILTPELGCNLENHLSHYQHKLCGILNGIDETHWDPSLDQALPHAYSSTLSAQEISDVKRQNRKAFLSVLGLTDREGPLLISVTRLVHQKGPELIAHAMRYTEKRGGLFVLIGSEAEEEVLQTFRALESPHIAAKLSFNEPLARFGYGAADAIVIPSLFEPCGLTQMIAMRYGTVPLVRHTGGLIDTVKDEHHSQSPNGFVFQTPDREALTATLDRLYHTYTHQKEQWHTRQTNGMQSNFGWGPATQNYLSVYQ